MLSIKQAQATLHLLGVPRLAEKFPPLPTTTESTINLVLDDALTYKNRQALRMRQTTPSILPFDLVARIIKQADGGRSTHMVKFKSVLNVIETLKYHTYADDEKREMCCSPWDGAEEPWKNLPTFFPPVSLCSKAARKLRGHPPDELEIERMDWWCPGGGGESTGVQPWGYLHTYQLRFQTWMFPGKRSIMGVSDHERERGLYFPPE